MFIIGEKLNSSIPKTGEAMKTFDRDYLARLIEAQAEAGADCLDINTAACGAERETELMLKIIEMALEGSDCSIMPDSPDPAVIKAAAAVMKGREFIINSVTASERIDELAPLVAEHNAGVVVLPLAGGGIPGDVDERVNNALAAAAKLTSAGVKKDKIYIDAIIEAISTSDNGALTALDTIRGIKAADPELKTVCGLSNVSFGLPKRASLNAAFLSMAVLYGLDAAIIDVLPNKNGESILQTLYAAKALAGRDEYCMDYITYIRSLQ